eukprot:scaffold73_cov337-Pavlova_lutheri.AAC.15
MPAIVIPTGNEVVRISPFLIGNARVHLTVVVRDERAEVYPRRKILPDAGRQNIANAVHSKPAHPSGTVLVVEKDCFPMYPRSAGHSAVRADNLPTSFPCRRRRALNLVLTIRVTTIILHQEVTHAAAPVVALKWARCTNSLGDGSVGPSSAVAVVEVQDQCVIFWSLRQDSVRTDVFPRTAFSTVALSRLGETPAGFHTILAVVVGAVEESTLFEPVAVVLHQEASIVGISCFSGHGMAAVVFSRDVRRLSQALAVVVSPHGGPPGLFLRPAGPPQGRRREQQRRPNAPHRRRSRSLARPCGHCCLSSQPSLPLNWCKNSLVSWGGGALGGWRHLAFFGGLAWTSVPSALDEGCLVWEQ